MGNILLAINNKWMHSEHIHFKELLKDSAETVYIGANHITP